MMDISQRLKFIREAERLKNVLRRAHTSEGRQESTAEHTWRLCLLAMVFEDQLPGLDFAKVLKMCVVHDLGEAIHGDVPAVMQKASDDKSQRERRDLLTLVEGLSPELCNEFLSLWDEYETATSAEAVAVKALDKLETLIQHNQGINPPHSVDYVFNLTYGRKYTDALPLFAEIRRLIDLDTQRKAVECEAGH
ncbi:MAG TPA: HD domain-containing protein [Chthoniobacterales bacterium]|nr:HD domain-containing protein [Chthoniobacterales bacterium]